MRMLIESVKNSSVLRWQKLKEKKYRDETGTFLIEGDHLLEEALKKDLVLEIISCDIKFKKANIPFYEVNETILKKLSNQVSGTNVLAVVKKIPEQPIKGNLCLLDNLQDPGNLGAIIRSAKAFNIDTIIMSNDTVDLYNDKVIRSSEGMLFHLNFIRTNLEEVIPKLKQNNYHIYGTNVEKGSSLPTIRFSEASAIIIGNEGKGMNKNLEKLCDTLINIPINNSCESLNASIAASIIFYEMSKNNF